MGTGKHILEYVYDNEQRYSGKTWFTSAGFRWKRNHLFVVRRMQQARAMAAHLQSLGYEPGSKIAMVSKNCAHFMMAELAIWMAGYVTVALYPTVNADTAKYVLSHSDAKLLFVGKLDTWEEILPGVPEDMPRIAFPLAPSNDYAQWDEIVTSTDPMTENPQPDRDALAMIIYTSGSTGVPKGVMHSFDAISRAGEGIVRGLKFCPDDRVLSYLPLAHVFERAYIETTTYIAATHVFSPRRWRPLLQISIEPDLRSLSQCLGLWLKFQLGSFKRCRRRSSTFCLRFQCCLGSSKRKSLVVLV